MARTDDRWPELPLAKWEQTYRTLQLWMQMVGKLRLAGCTPVNHFWHAAFRATARGFGGEPIRYGHGYFDADFDFIAHQLVLRTSRGEVARIPLVAQTVADFYAELRETLDTLDIDLPIRTMPVELSNPIPFDQDRIHSAYDPEYARRWWRICLEVDSVLKEFRAGFVGKTSPVHFFWGSFDLCVTRFSGRRAPPRPNADAVMREAYSHECSSAGFWPGGGEIPDAAFYAYAWPIPPGFENAVVAPADAYWSTVLGEFVLPYEAVRLSPDPRSTLLSFLHSTYDAAADLGHWDRAELERERPPRVVPVAPEKIQPEQPTA